MKDDKDSTTSSAFSKIPSVKIPDMKIPDMNMNIDLRSTIKTGVQKTNNLLSDMQTKKTEVSNLTSSRIRPLANQVARFATKAVTAYENRSHYGPQIVAGSAATVGIVVAARRGKVPGVLMGGLAGYGANKAVYPKN